MPFTGQIGLQKKEITFISAHMLLSWHSYLHKSYIYVCAFLHITFIRYLALLAINMHMIILAIYSILFISIYTILMALLLMCDVTLHVVQLLSYIICIQYSVQGGRGFGAESCCSVTFLSGHDTSEWRSPFSHPETGQ